MFFYSFQMDQNAFMHQVEARSHKQWVITNLFVGQLALIIKNKLIQFWQVKKIYTSKYFMKKKMMACLATVAMAEVEAQTEAIVVRREISEW